MKRRKVRKRKRKNERTKGLVGWTARISAGKAKVEDRKKVKKRTSRGYEAKKRGKEAWREVGMRDRREGERKGWQGIKRETRLRISKKKWESKGGRVGKE